MGRLTDFLVNRLLRERLGCRLKWMIRYEQDLRIPVPCPPLKIPLTIREVKEEDLPAFLSFVAPDLPPELRQELRQGHLCVGAFDQDRAVGYTWANPNQVYEISTGLQSPLKPHEVYTYRKLVDPAFRNLGVSARLDWERNRILAAKGFRHKVSFMDRGNYAARRSSGRAGSRPVRHLIFLQAFGLQLTLSLPMKKAGPGRRSRAWVRPGRAGPGRSFFFR